MRTCLEFPLLIICFVALTPSLLSAQTAADADFDGNGHVGFADFVIFARAYNSTEAKYDLDGSGLVDFQDFLLFAGFFGQATSSTDFTFPLSAGNTWKYRVTAERSSQLSSSTIEHIQWEVDVLWQIKGKESVLGTDAYRMETTHHFLSGPDSGKVVTGRTWFSMKGDTLWAVASQDIGELLPESAQLHKAAVTFTQDMPARWGVVVLVFPLKIGSEWDYGFAASRKAVEAVEEVSVLNETFEAFKVVRIFDIPSVQIRTEQWFGSIGLIRMKEELLSTQTRTDERGNVIGKVVDRRIVNMELESYQLR